MVVTGANGFVGANLVRRALADDWSVTALSRSREKLATLNAPNLTVFDWSVGEPMPDPGVLEAADVVFHLAALIPQNYADPDCAGECFRINALGALQMATLALQAKVGRFVLFSSGQIYARRERPAKEEDPAFPSQRAVYYLGSKLMAELFVENLRLIHKLPATILRLSSVYGSGMTGNGLVSRFARAAAAGDPLIVHDGGAYAADFVFVDDVAAAALAAIENRADGIFNIGSGEATTTLDLAHLIVNLLGADPKQIKMEPGAPGTSPAGFSALDISKARGTFGYKPRPPEEGLKCWLAAAATPA